MSQEERYCDRWLVLLACLLACLLSLSNQYLISKFLVDVLDFASQVRRRTLVDVFFLKRAVELNARCNGKCPILFLFLLSFYLNSTGEDLQLLIPAPCCDNAADFNFFSLLSLWRFSVHAGVVLGDFGCPSQTSDEAVVGFNRLDASSLLAQVPAF